MTGPLTDFLYRLVAVAGAALVLQFFSEFYFLNEGPAAEAARGIAALPGMVELALWYALFAYIFLIVIDQFEVRTWGGLLLAGSVFGWATEGLVIPLVYEAPPVSFIWPAVAWHALIDVIAGWYLLRLAMRRLTWPWLALLFATLGVFWAFWATWTWGAAEGGTVVYTTAEFWNIVLVSGASWVIGTVLADIGARRRFKTSLWEIGLVGLVALTLFVITGLPYLPWSVALALLIAVTFGALAWARRGGVPGPDRLAPLGERPPLIAYCLMPILPVAAGLSYPFVLDHGLVVPAEDITSLLFTLGTLGLAWALVRSALDGRTP